MLFGALGTVCLTRLHRTQARIGVRPVLVTISLSGLVLLTPILSGDDQLNMYVFIVASLFLGLFLVYAISFERFCDVYVRVLVAVSAVSLVLMSAARLSSGWVSLLPTQPGPYVDYKNAGLYLFIVSREMGLEGVVLDRNVGIAWEPGAFAVLICLAIAMLVLRLREATTSTARDAVALSVLIAANLLTFSVTGYVCMVLVLLPYLATRLMSRSFLIGALGVVALVIIWKSLDLRLFEKDRIWGAYGGGGVAERISADRVNEMIVAPWFPMGSSYTWVSQNAPDVWNSIINTAMALGVLFVLYLGLQYLRFAGLFGGQGWAVALFILVASSSQNFFVSPLFLALAMYGAANVYEPPRGFRRPGLVSLRVGTRRVVAA